jgi:hypothetical protein
MKMKRTLIAIAVVALLATSAHAAIEVWPFLDVADHSAIKVDGKETKEFRWPYEIIYQELTVCTIPVYMKVGMFVQVEDCANKKIVLEQVSCTDFDQITGGAIGNKGAGDYPCYWDCEDIRVRANFPVELGLKLNKGDMIPDSTAYFDGDNTVPDDGSWKDIKICVAAWKAQIYKAKPHDEVTVGSVEITVKPQ